MDKQLNETKENFDDILSRHKIVIASITLNEKSQVWKDFETGYDNDISVSITN